MIVILEGIDGSGKSTLAKAIKDNIYDSEVLRPLPRYSSFNANYSFWQKQMYHDTVFINDRSFITDIVYRLVDDKLADNFDLRAMCSVLFADCKIIYCKSASSFEDSIARGEDNITDKETSDKLSATYDTVINLIKKFTRANVMQYDYHTTNISEIINFIKGEKNGIR